MCNSRGAVLCAVLFIELTRAFAIDVIQDVNYRSIWQTVTIPRSHIAPSTHSISTQTSSLANKSLVLTESTRTSAMTTTEAMTSPITVTVDQMAHLPSVHSDENAAQLEEGNFHTLPLRRKGHILRTTAGMVVNKSRLSALFRKDAVPILDKAVPTPESSPAKPKRKMKLRTSTNLTREDPQPVSQRRSRITALPSLPTIPDTPVSPQNPDAADTVAAGTYTTPTPPSFLSPFWYRPEEYGRLPASPPSSRPTSVKTTGPVIARPKHAHTRSEPFPTFQHAPCTVGDPNPKEWKRRMSGFFRHSIGVV